MLLELDGYAKVNPQIWASSSISHTKRKVMIW